MISYIFQQCTPLFKDTGKGLFETITHFQMDHTIDTNDSNNLCGN